MRYRCAVLDDYQNAALTSADWSALAPDVEVVVFNRYIEGEAAVVEALREFDIVCAMRERTKFSRPVFEQLDRLKLIVTTGMRNAAIDMTAAKDRGVLVCGSDLGGPATAELVFGHILEFARKVGQENAALKAGRPWQTTLGIELAGKTLGVVGLGKLGSHVARIGAAFGMRVIAWSPNLTPEKCAGTGATYASRDELFGASDFISIHLVLSDRSRGLIGRDDLMRMKPTAFLVNTSRGPIVEEAALLEVLREGRIAGAGLDVFDVEPLPLHHPLRGLERAQLTPHLGYVTADGYRIAYGQTVEDITAFVAGKPVRVITA